MHLIEIYLISPTIILSNQQISHRPSQYNPYKRLHIIEHTNKSKDNFSIK